MMQAATFAAVFAVLFTSHVWADHAVNAAKAVSTMPSVSVPRLASRVGGSPSQGAGVAVVRRHRLASRFAHVGGR